MVESHKGQWRARLRFNLNGTRATVLGPCRTNSATAERDLAALLRAKTASMSSEGAYEAVAAAAAELKASAAKSAAIGASTENCCQDDENEAGQKVEVERLARRAVAAMEGGDRAAAAEALTSLLCYPASLDTGFVSGRTLLSEAVRWNCPELVDALLDYGADPNAPCASGLAPLHLAAMNGKLAFMHSLLLWGADPARPDSGGLTPLQKAVLTAPPTALAGARELLLSAGARESAADRHRMAAREAADKNDAVYLARLRGDGAAPPGAGIASSSL